MANPTDETAFEIMPPSIIGYVAANDLRRRFKRAIEDSRAPLIIAVEHGALCAGSDSLFLWEDRQPLLMDIL